MLIETSINKKNNQFLIYYLFLSILFLFHLREKKERKKTNFDSIELFILRCNLNKNFYIRNENIYRQDRAINKMLSN